MMTVECTAEGRTMGAFDAAYLELCKLCNRRRFVVASIAALIADACDGYKSNRFSIKQHQSSTEISRIMFSSKVLIVLLLVFVAFVHVQALTNNEAHAACAAKSEHDLIIPHS